MKLSSKILFFLLAVALLLTACGQETTFSTADRTVNQNTVVITGADGRRYVLALNENPDPKVLINLQTLAANALTLETTVEQQRHELAKLNAANAREAAARRDYLRLARFSVVCLSLAACVIGCVGIRYAWRGGRTS